jgi:poly(3-hydroxybutyrate) depolymerase
MHRRMRRSIVLAVAVTAAALLPGAPAWAQAAAGGWGGVATYPANRTVDTTLYDGGTWSYTDRWGDDTGANSDGKHREDYFPGQPLLTYDAFGTHRLAHDGDYVLPNDDTRFPELTADVVFAQARPTASGVDVRVVFSSLGEADSAILTLGLNTTGGHGSSQFPRNARLACTGCGIDRYVTVWGTGGDVADSTGRHTGDVQDLGVDLAENAVTFSVPFSALGPVGSSVGAWLAAGAHDGAGQYLTVQPVASQTAPGGGTGGTNVFDLAFVHEDRAILDERVQADLLATGDAGPARAVVDLTALRNGTHRLVGEPTSGPVERILVSALDEGDGIDTGNGPGSFQSPTPGGNYHYLGRLQPYLVDLPPGHRPGGRYPEVMVLHGYNGFYDEEWFLAPQLRRATEQGGFLGVYPLGRGDVQYEHDGENDVVEVQRAVAAAYPVDPSRVQVTGISMGGFGTTKMVTRHPDVFASGGVAVGGEQQDVNVVNDRLDQYPLNRLFAPVVPNLQDTPVLLATGVADVDPATSAATAFYEQLRAVGDEAHLKDYLLRSHEPEVLDDSTHQLVAMWQRAGVTPVPPRVSYTFDTTWDFGPLVDDGAYWLDALRPRTGTQGTATAEALTLPRTTTTLTESRSTGGSALDRSLYVLLDSLRQATGARPRSNTLTLGLTDVASGSVTLTGLQVDRGRRYCVDVTTDGGSTVTLAGLDFRGDTVAGAPAQVSADSVVLTLPAGSSHVVLAPAGVAPAPGTPCS